MHRMPKHRGEMRLERARAVGVEPAVRNAEFVRQRELARERRERRVAAIELEPALPAQVAAGAGLRQQQPHAPGARGRTAAA